MIQNSSDSTNLIEYINRLWPIFITVIGFLAWFVRRDSKQVFLENKIEELAKRIDERDKALWNAFNDLQKTNQKEFREILQALGKIEGKLENQ